MNLLKALKPEFLIGEDSATGPRRHLFNFRRIWQQAVLVTSMVALAPLIFMALVDYQVSQQAIESEINYQTAQLVSNTRRSVSFYLSERQSALNFIDKDNSYPALGDPLRLTALLENLRKGFGGFTDLGVIGDNGIQHAYIGPYGLTGRDYSDQDWFKELRSSGAHVSDVFLGFRKEPHLVIAVKHDLPGGGFYVLRTSIDTVLINQLLSAVEVSGNGDLFLVNREGVLQGPSRFFGEALGKLPIAVPQYSERTRVVEVDFTDGQLVVGYAYIAETPFILMAVKKKSELMKPWNATRKKLIFFLIFSITAILLVILWVSTHLVSQIHEADRKRVMTLHHVEYANKMASLGRLSAGVAHEINNPLAIINEKAGLIKDLFSFKQAYAEDPKLLGLADSILYSVERCGKITKRLLNFARHVDVNPQPLEVGKVIHEVLGFLGKEAEFRSITVTVDEEPELPEIESDQGRLQEIFLNLINNSLAAMQDGGCLDITARRSGEGFIAVSVADSGCGIPETDLKRVFEPFFSTKTKSGGTGLGLSITYGLVQELGGDISVRSEEGKGTEFTISLPIKMKSPGVKKT